MTIKTSTLLDVALEFARTRRVMTRDDSPVMKDGFAVMAVPDEVYLEWDKSSYPLVGKEGWNSLVYEFGERIPTSESSVHHGADLPNDGIAVLPWGQDKELVLQQRVTDVSWWSWYWDPVAVVVDPD